MSSISPSSAFADSIVHEMLVEVLSHDIDVWGGSGREDGTDFNAELEFSPSVQLLGGKVRSNSTGMYMKKNGA